MALSEEDKERIREEEKVRMEYRREFLQGSRGCCGRGCGGWFFRGLFVLLAFFALAHLWHRHCGGSSSYCNPAVSQPAPGTAAPNPAPK